MSWLDSEKGRKAYIENLKSIKEDNKNERERLSQIRDYEKDEIVSITYKKTSYDGIVKKVNQKSYTVLFDTDRLVSIGKETLSGTPKDVIEDRTGDGRRFVGENVYISKKK